MNYHKLSMTIIPIEQQEQFNILLNDNIELINQFSEVSK